MADKCIEQANDDVKYTTQRWIKTLKHVELEVLTKKRKTLMEEYRANLLFCYTFVILCYTFAILEYTSFL